MDVTAPRAPARDVRCKDNDCTLLSGTLTRFGEKWTSVAVMLISFGTRRFNQLRRELPGISQQMLTRTLRGLERDGMITRKVHATVPPVVEYTITDLGMAMAERVKALGQWAMENSAAIEAARADYDKRA